MNMTCQRGCGNDTEVLRLITRNSSLFHAIFSKTLLSPFSFFSNFFQIFPFLLTYIFSRQHDMSICHAIISWNVLFSKSTIDFFQIPNYFFHAVFFCFVDSNFKNYHGCRSFLQNQLKKWFFSFSFILDVGYSYLPKKTAALILAIMQISHDNPLTKKKKEPMFISGSKRKVMVNSWEHIFRVSKLYYDKIRRGNFW